MDQELKQLLESLKDPEAVLINMMRGIIAKPSVRAFSKLFGDVINGEDAQLLEIARLREERAKASQRGEAVEVVGYLYKAHSGVYSQMPGDEWEPLMTVAQHQRILAAANHPADKVASAELLDRLAHYLECSSNLTSADYGSEGYDLARELRALLAKP